MSISLRCLRHLLFAELVFCLCSSSSSVMAQAAKAAPAETPSGLGFSIETEMLTYRALESNSEAIACDVAAYLFNTSANFKNPSPGAICDVKASAQPVHPGVVILPFDNAIFNNFAEWREDMQKMQDSVARLACTPKAPAAAPGAGPEKRGGTGIGSILALTPLGQASNAMSGALGLLASATTTSAVTGTIQDQAFMSGVSRELRAVNVTVLLPSAYAPYALTTLDPSRSPFLTLLAKLDSTRECLVAANGASDPGVKDIDTFVAGLAAPTTAVKTAPAAAAAAPAAASTVASSAPSRLATDLAADGLAVRMGADIATGKIPDSAPQHLLLVKALESGGSVNHFTNILGTRISYSGGSVGTYELFNLNGELECSGNVYDYAGAISSKKFQQHLREYKPDPSRQVIFQRGSCSR